MQAIFPALPEVMKSSLSSLPALPIGVGGGDMFSQFLEKASRQLDELRSDAETKVRALMIGDGTDIHTAMIATQKADLSFELALATRNKAIGAYQQLMNVQF